MSITSPNWVAKARSIGQGAPTTRRRLTFGRPTFGRPVFLRQFVGRLGPALRRPWGSAPLRRALLRRTGALTVAILVAVLVGRSAADAEATRDRWDATEDVLVARRNLPIGTALRSEDLEVQTRPAALVPDGSLREIPADPGHVSSDIAEGEVVLEGRVGDGLSGSGAVPTGRGAVEVESPGSVPVVDTGDRVDVLAAPPPSGDMAELIRPTGPDGDSPDAEAVERAAMVVAEDAIVMEGGHGTGSSLTLAVSDADIAATAAALLEGPVAIVVRPSPR